eukprot:SAG22_NODE_4574_length_1229_cov_1.119469_1_plen_62_part_10
MPSVCPSGADAISNGSVPGGGGGGGGAIDAGRRAAGQVRLVSGRPLTLLAAVVISRDIGFAD